MPGKSASKKLYKTPLQKAERFSAGAARDRRSSRSTRKKNVAMANNQIAMAKRKMAARKPKRAM